MRFRWDNPWLRALLLIFVAVLMSVGIVYNMAQAVNAAEALNNSNWIPMNVVVYDAIAILKVLTLGQAIG